MTRILVDADACPVIPIILRVAAEHRVPVTLLCDTAHEMHRDGAETIVVEKGADSVDFKLVNLVRDTDIVVTQDYGLAAMCLARRARVLHQNGIEYTDRNIDSMLLSRHIGKKIRRAGGRTKGPSPRTAAQDAAFEQALHHILQTTKKALTDG